MFPTQRYPERTLKQGEAAIAGNLHQIRFGKVSDTIVANAVA